MVFELAETKKKLFSHNYILGITKMCRDEFLGISLWFLILQELPWVWFYYNYLEK